VAITMSANRIRMSGAYHRPESGLVSVMRLLATLLVLLPVTAFAQAPAGTGVPQTDEEKTLYAVGLVMQRSLRQFDLSAAEVEIIRRALADAQAGKPAVDLDEWGPKIQALVTARGWPPAVPYTAVGACSAAPRRSSMIRLAAGSPSMNRNPASSTVTT